MDEYINTASLVFNIVVAETKVPLTIQVTGPTGVNDGAQSEDQKGKNKPDQRQDKKGSNSPERPPDHRGKYILMSALRHLVTSSTELHPLPPPRDLPASRPVDPSPPTEGSLTSPEITQLAFLDVDHPLSFLDVDHPLSPDVTLGDVSFSPHPSM